jgi:ATP-dependent helicase Lhr and Lhr-like helicase
LTQELRLTPPAAGQLASYLAASKAALGVLPTHDTIVFERFFDEVGDTHLVIHSPYGSRVNRAWALALRKRFCRQFNFELQASALEDSIVLSLGPTHSFPLEDVKSYLKSATAREVLVQALLAAPMFPTRWRWNAAVALAVRRMQGGKRLPPPFQRADAEDLLAVIFPDQLACAENIAGDREVPDHPLVRQTVDDCLHETMDVSGFLALLRDIESGAVKVVCRDLAGPSPLAHAILGARPYAFLDDGDAEGRRTRAVNADRVLDPQSAADLGALDPGAITRVQAEAWPDITSPDELHDALVVHGFLTQQEAAPWGTFREPLERDRRMQAVTVADGEVLWVAVERLPELQAALQPGAADHAVALKEVLRSRLELLGPVTEAALAAPLGLDSAAVRATLLALEAEGGVMRGQYSPTSVIPAEAGIQRLSKALGPGWSLPRKSVIRGRDDVVHENDVEWCDRRLLLRIHRYTRERRRAEIQPVAPAQFMRFLFRWQRVATESRDDRREGEDGLFAVLQQLEGCAIPVAAWEEDILPARVRHYSADQLDRLCAAGRINWWRPADGNGDARKSGPVRSTPIVLAERVHVGHWQALASPPPQPSPARGEGGTPWSARAERVLEKLRTHGASFLGDLVHDTGLLRSEVETALGELVSHGRVHSDSFAGLRALVAPARRRERLRRYGRAVSGLDEGGRWSLPRAPRPVETAGALAEPAVEHIARVLLRRYGVVFRKLLEREEYLPPWRDLFYVYRRLEARGEIRGGRFVSGFSGEQFALPEAAEALRRFGADADAERVSISAADPLNLAGIVTPGERIPSLASNRVLFENGVPVAAQSGGEIRYLRAVDEKSQWEIRNLLVRRRQPGNYIDAAHTTQ